MIPAIVMDKVPLLGIFAWFFYTTGFIYFCFFQLAVYNKQTVALNEKVTSRQTQQRHTNGCQLRSFRYPVDPVFCR